MNPFQAQQYLGRMLNNRRYEGYTVDSKHSVGLDEFIGLIRQYQTSTHTPDREVLNQVGTYMTGNAFRWWQANSMKVNTIADLENRLRVHFERQATDETSIIVDFASHRQGKDEDLLDFIDEMRQRYLRCSPIMSEWKAVEIIVNNTNDTFNNLLAARVYHSLEHLSQHAEYMMRGKPRRTANVNKFEKKPQPYRARVNATEEIVDFGNETEPSESYASETIENYQDDTPQLVEQIISAFRSNFKSKSAQQHSKGYGSENKAISDRKVPNKVEVQPIICTNCLKWGHAFGSCVEPKVLRCYGCGKEGVIKDKCDVCNGQKPKNM